MLDSAAAMPRAFELGQGAPPRVSSFMVGDWRCSYTVEPNERTLTVVDLCPCP